MGDSIEEKQLAIEQQKLTVEQDKLKLEGSWKKVWSAPILAAIVTVGVALITVLMNHHQTGIANRQAESTAKQQEGQWGISVLELYITHPDAFDPKKSPTTASQNLNALAAAAPEVMKPILLERQDSFLRSGLPMSSEEFRAITDAIGVAQSGLQAGAAGMGQAGTSPLGASPVITVYVQYGPRSADQASGVEDKLRAQGFRVPAAEVAKEPTLNPEVRYYRPDQKMLADKIAATVGLGATAVFAGGDEMTLGNFVEVRLP